MGKLYISNTFCLSMLDREDQGGSSMSNRLDISNDYRRKLMPKTLEDIKNITQYVISGGIWRGFECQNEIVSLIATKSEADSIGAELGLKLETNQCAIKLTRADSLVVSLPQNIDGKVIYEYWMM